jgi:DNA-binding PucR family transcriptional regulator
MAGRSRTAATWRIDQIPHEAADCFRAHATDLAAEMVHEIQARIPEYARPLDQSYNRTIQLGVEQALRRFLDLLDRREVQDQSWRDVYAAIGAGEMREGRSLDALQAAIRVGARVVWRRLVSMSESEALSLREIGPLAEAIFAYLDDIADASAAGYAHAKAAEVGEVERRRRRLIELLVAEPPAPIEAVAAAAGAAGWQLPRRLAAVAVEAPAALTAPPLLSPEILVGFERAEPCLLVPDPEGAAQVRVLVNGLARYRAAVGPAVPPADAAKSLRWACRALDLAGRGVITGDGMVWCGDQLATLTIFQDEDLLATLVERRLGPLARLRDTQRDLLADTLLAWLQSNMNANAVAARLHVHPQTVRHRLRHLRRVFGDQMRDPDLRFELEIALRAASARRRCRQ